METACLKERFGIGLLRRAVRAIFMLTRYTLSSGLPNCLLAFGSVCHFRACVVDSLRNYEHTNMYRKHRGASRWKSWMDGTLGNQDQGNNYKTPMP